MRPLLGVVVRASRRALDIRLESGTLVSTTNDFGLGKYDHVAVNYDYTENRVVNIEPYDPDSEHVEAGDLSDTDVVEDESSDEDGITDAELEDDSGALYPVLCDEDWDSESGVLRMEGESSIE